VQREHVLGSSDERATGVPPAQLERIASVPRSQYRKLERVRDVRTKREANAGA
jgi:hypothetical protein